MIELKLKYIFKNVSENKSPILKSLLENGGDNIMTRKFKHFYSNINGIKIIKSGIKNK